MKNLAVEAPPVFSPHLKSSTSFVPLLARALGGTLVLCFAGIFLGGTPFLSSAGIFLAVIVAGDFAFQALGLSVSPRWDLALFHQALLASLFLPRELPVLLCIAAAVVLISFYRLSGGRAGYVLQPACLALAFLKIMGTEPVFILISAEPLASAILFVLWLIIRFPRTRIEAERMAFVLVLTFFTCVLHETAWVNALLWSAAAGELVFDSALQPLSKTGRLWHGALTLGLFALLLASSARIDALLLTGLVAGFFAGWIEERSLPRKVYGFTQPR